MNINIGGSANTNLNTGVNFNVQAPKVEVKPVTLNINVPKIEMKPIDLSIKMPKIEANSNFNLNAGVNMNAYY